MDLQCSLIIGVYNNRHRVDLKLYNEDCLLELSDSQIEIIPEYESFDILVTSDDSDTGYFELPELEDYDIQNRTGYSGTDDNNKYSFNQHYCIYAYSFENKKSSIDLQTVPLTPGYYTVRVIDSEGDVSFAYWYISPKELTTPEWQIMRDDVESMVKGLALDYSRQMRSKVRSIEGKSAPDALDNDTAFLIDHETKIRYAVETLRNEAKYQISKKYLWVVAGSKGEIDQRTIRKIGERPDKGGMFYSPRRYLEYDVAANQWLKLFLIRLVKLCGKQITYNRQIMATVENEHNKQQGYSQQWTESERQHVEKDFTSSLAELQKAKTALRKLQEYLRLVLEDTFLKSASMPSSTVLPKALMLNTSYNLLYRIYMVLFQKKDQFILEKPYHWYWKKTARLYEIWTFISVLKSLIRQGFKPMSGWIYDEHGRDRVLPFLTEGTKVSFFSGELFVNLTYNETIPSDKRQVSASRPLVTVSARNKPDIRIDVFNLEERYLGSVLLDAKYIKLINIFKRLRSSNQNKLRDQFTSYVNDTSSPFHDNYKYMKDMRPVSALLVLYPTSDSAKSAQEESRYTGRNVRYIQARPGVDLTELDSVLSKNIANISERSSLLPVK